MRLLLQRSISMFNARETSNQPKDNTMTLMTDIRSRLAKRAAYNRTVYELSHLPTEFAINDLGFAPCDAAKIASKAVYGK